VNSEVSGDTHFGESKYQVSRHKYQVGVWKTEAAQLPLQLEF